jgi:hypothetical protein
MTMNQGPNEQGKDFETTFSDLTKELASLIENQDEEGVKRILLEMEDAFHSKERELYDEEPKKRDSIERILGLKKSVERCFQQLGSPRAEELTAAFSGLISNREIGSMHGVMEVSKDMPVTVSFEDRRRHKHEHITTVGETLKLIAASIARQVNASTETAE